MMVWLVYPLTTITELFGIQEAESFACATYEAEICDPAGSFTSSSAVLLRKKGARAPRARAPPS